MGLSPGDVGAMSMGQWLAVVQGWNRTHAEKAAMAAPSDDEFEAAILAARSIH